MNASSASQRPRRRKWRFRRLLRSAVAICMPQTPEGATMATDRPESEECRLVGPVRRRQTTVPAVLEHVFRHSSGILEATEIKPLKMRSG